MVRTERSRRDRAPENAKGILASVELDRKSSFPSYGVTSSAGTSQRLHWGMIVRRTTVSGSKRAERVGRV
jgi:hypothetical protein